MEQMDCGPSMVWHVTGCQGAVLSLSDRTAHQRCVCDLRMWVVALADYGA